MNFRLRAAYALRGLACATLWMAGLALAHKPSDAYLSLRVDGATIEQRLDIALRDLDRDLLLDADDNGQLSWGEVRGRWAEIEGLAAAGVRVAVGGQICRVASRAEPQLDEHSDGRYVVLTKRLVCDGPVRALSVDYSLFQRSDPTHRGIVRMVAGTSTQPAVLTPGNQAWVFATQLDPRATPPSFLGFVAEGVHHILSGIDHILFLLALLLPSVLVRGPNGWQPAPQWKPVLLDVLRIVTAFTVAHSITLALAVLDIVDPPSRWVESVIAASVVFAALNNLRPVVGRRRWLITFAFGLVHGFGFAGALKDLGLGEGTLVAPLLGFNLGVELGQLAIVALFVPLAWALRPTPMYRRGAFMAGSVAIAVLASVWLAERAFDVELLGLV
jgi:uncharacterized membrane protein YqjE